MGVFDDTFCQGDIFLEGMLGTVDHNGRESAVHASLADVKVRAVVQMEGDGQPRVLHGSLDELRQVDMLGVFTGPGGNLQDQRRLFLDGGLDDTLDDFHVVDVERTDGIMALIGLAEHLFRIDKRHVDNLLKVNIGKFSTSR